MSDELNTREAVCRRIVDGPDLEWHEVTRLFFDESEPLGPALCNLCPQRGQCVLAHLVNTVTIPQAGMGANVRGRYRRKLDSIPRDRWVTEAAQDAYKSNENLIRLRCHRDRVLIRRVHDEAQRLVDAAPLTATSLRAPA